MRKVYVAGKWEDRLRIQQVMIVLLKAGYAITEDWTFHHYEDSGYPIQYSQDDIEGVRNCDIFIGLFEAQYVYRGALVEMGAALALDKEVCIVGNAMDSCMFINHPLVKRFPLLYDLYKYLEVKNGNSPD